MRLSAQTSAEQTSAMTTTTDSTAVIESPPDAPWICAPTQTANSGAPVNRFSEASAISATSSNRLAWLAAIGAVLRTRRRSELLHVLVVGLANAHPDVLV